MQEESRDMKTSLYHERILELADNAEYVRIIERPDREASGTNALCGDRVSIQLEMDRDEIRRLYYQVRGCLLCRASCTELARIAAGLDRTRLKVLRDALERFLRSPGNGSTIPPGLHVFEPVRAHRSRHRCVLLPYDAALQALSDPDI